MIDRMRKSAAAWAAALGLLGALAACATTPPQLAARMTLSHHEFEPWSFVPRAGEPIEIDNRSDIAHSIYITYPDGTVVSLGTQLPGTVLRWTPPQDGEFVLRCWIHPVIRAALTVGAGPVSGGGSDGRRQHHGATPH